MKKTKAKATKTKAIEPSMIYPPVAVEPISYGRRVRTSCPDHQAVINPESGSVYCVPTRQYQLLKHEDAIEGIEKVIHKMPQFGKWERKIDFFNDGGRMTAEYKFTDRTFQVDKGDKLHPTINARNSYDLGWVFVINFGIYRLICANGAIIGEKFASYKRKHTTGLEFEQVEKILEYGMDKFSDQVDLYKTWLDINTTSRELEDVHKIFSGKEFKEIIVEKEIGSKETIQEHASFEMVKQEGGPDKLLVDTDNKLNKWVLFNILTQYITHSVKNKNRQVALQTKMGKLF